MAGVKSLVRVAPALVLLACAHAGEAPGDLSALCPAALAGVEVRAVDLPQGAAFEFLGPPAREEEVRARARRMVERYREKGGIYADQRVSFVEFVAASTSVEEVAGGARVVFAARSERDVEILQNVVRSWAGRMRAQGACPQGQGAAGLVPPPW